MPRIRTIKPEFPTSESMCNVTRDARLCFILLWTVADDEGRLRGKPQMLAGTLFPCDTDAPALISDWLSELEREQCIRCYVADGRQYIQIVNWLKQQKIEKPTPSKFPTPREDSPSPPRIVVEDSPTDRGKVAVGREGKGREGRGKGRERKARDKSRASAASAAFVLPDWIAIEDWAAFEEMRTKCRATMTDRARKNIIAELVRLRDAGDDPTQVLNRSITNGWKGVFPLDDPKHHRGGSNGKYDDIETIRQNVIREHCASLDESSDLPWSENGQNAVDDVLATPGSRK